MTEYAVKDIPADSFFSEPAYLDDQFALLAPEMPFTDAFRKILLRWDFPLLMSDGEPRTDTIKTRGGRGGERIVDNTELTDGMRIERAVDFYRAFERFVDRVFTQIALQGEIEFKTVAEKVKEICDTIKDDRRFLLRVIRSPDSTRVENFLAVHAAKSAIISITIGVYLKLPNHRLIELGVAALLHEVGMIKLPPNIYLANRALDPQERKAILTHPVLGYQMLKSFDFPLTVSMAALEHHERENGAGYPHKLTGDKISLYAKIIAVACSYEAMTGARPYKDANDGYTGMLDLLKNVGNQYDDTVVRALVYSLSIYPIGLYVLLSNGKKGQVVDVNPENPRYPIVQIFGEVTPDNKNRTLETSPEGLHITRPLVREEIDPKTP